MVNPKPVRESQYPRCPTHGLRYNPAQYDGCVLCRRDEELQSAEQQGSFAPPRPQGQNMPPPMRAGRGVSGRRAPSYGSFDRVPQGSQNTGSRVGWWLAWGMIALVLGVLFVGGLFVSNMIAKARRGGARGGAGLGGYNLSVSQAFDKVRASDGEVVIVHVWATWCGSCMREMPALVQAIQELQPKGVKVFMFAVGSRRSTVQRVVRRYGDAFLPYRLVRARYRGQLGAEFRRLGGRYRGSIPYTMILDRRGRLVRQWTGARHKQTYLEAIRPLL